MGSWSRGPADRPLAPVESPPQLRDHVPAALLRGGLLLPGLAEDDHPVADPAGGVAPDVPGPVLAAAHLHLGPGPGQAPHVQQPDVRVLGVGPPTPPQHQQVVPAQLDLALAVPGQRSVRNTIEVR